MCQGRREREIKREEKMTNIDEHLSIELPAPSSWKKLVYLSFYLFPPSFVRFYFFLVPLQIDICIKKGVVLSALLSLLSKFLLCSCGLEFT